ncbi:HicB-like antitoxin of toxin-antitoxin system domain-containing protein [Candidatus Electronema halotolerans]|jgi:antitoxin HicB
MGRKVNYPFEVRPLTAEEGGGFLILFPDLPGCIADGETLEEAVMNGLDAVHSWLATAEEFNDPIPEPESSSRLVQRLPKSLYAKLAACARQEGVSMNTLVTAMIAESLERRTILS